MKYLLVAPDEDMTAWKQAAVNSGMSLAAFLREAANEKLWADQNRKIDGASGLQEFISTNVNSVGGPLTEETMRRAIDSGREFKPDPKPTKGKK